MAHILRLSNLHVFLIVVWMFIVETQIIHGPLKHIGHVLTRIQVSPASASKSRHFPLRIKNKLTISIAPPLLIKVVKLYLIHSKQKLVLLTIPIIFPSIHTYLTKLRVLNHLLVFLTINHDHFRGQGFICFKLIVEHSKSST